MMPVLFIISFKNFNKYSAMRLNSPAYTPYPAEKEVILCEGAPMIVLDVEFTRIKNNYKGFEKYNDKMITLIHLYQ